MAKKTCPNCGVQHGPRKKECECGHNFDVQSTPSVAQDYVGGGLWRLYRTIKSPKDLPPLHEPPRIPKGRLLTVTEAQQYVAYEGVGDAVEFISPKMIENQELREAWEECAKAMRRVRHLVYKEKRNDDAIYDDV